MLSMQNSSLVAPNSPPIHMYFHICTYHKRADERRCSNKGTNPTSKDSKDNHSYDGEDEEVTSRGEIGMQLLSDHESAEEVVQLQPMIWF